MKPESEWTLEDWVVFHTAKCECSGHYQCAGCTLKALEDSWRATLKVERSVHLALKNQYEALKKARENHDASKHNPTERP